MKKTILLLLSALLVFGAFGCSGTQQYVTPCWEYEKIEYYVAEGSEATTGTLVMIAEELDQGRWESIYQINAEGKVEEKHVELSSGSFVLTGRLEFKGDVMEYKTITNKSFAPLYSYKYLIIENEGQPYTGNGQAPACVSYFLSTSYDVANNSAQSYYLRQKEYGEMNFGIQNPAEQTTANLEFESMSFKELKANTYDINQTYYVIRGVNNLFSDSFNYSFYVPMALESNTKNVYVTGKSSQSIALDNFPYVETKYANNDDFALTLTEATITPTGEAIRGSSIKVYYAETDIHSSEQTDLTATPRCVRVPLKMIENNRLTNTDEPNQRGVITYSIKNISTIKM